MAMIGDSTGKHGVFNGSDLVCGCFGELEKQVVRSACLTRIMRITMGSILIWDIQMV